jgi:hypothetical protein
LGLVFKGKLTLRVKFPREGCEVEDVSFFPVRILRLGIIPEIRKAIKLIAQALR